MAIAERNKGGAPEAPAADDGRYAARERARREAQKLVRVRISCMNPSKRDLKGEIITVANSVLTMRKFVPYGDTTRDGWHVPQCILDAMSDARYISIKQGEDVKAPPEMDLMPEYAIEILPPLTREEIDQIGIAQLQG